MSNKLTKLDVQLYDLFDDWSEIDPRQKHFITKEECISELKKIAKRLHRSPTAKEFNKDASMCFGVVYKLFGSFNKGLKAAGLKVNNDPTAVTKTQAFAELKRVAKQLGHTPTQTEFNQYGSMCTGTVEHLLGTWNKVLDAAGLTRCRSRGFTKAQALVELKRVAIKVGHTPNMHEFDTQGSIMHSSTVARLFSESWNKALRAASLRINHNNTAITKVEAIKELRRVFKTLGRTPMAKEFEEHASMSNVTVIKLFGLWNTALKAAGLKLNKRRRG